MVCTIPKIPRQPLTPLVPNRTVSVGTYTELSDAIANTASGEVVGIEVTASFSITATLLIDNNKSILLFSPNGTTHTLTRDSNDVLFNVNGTSSVLSMNNILIDGNSIGYPVQNTPLINIGSGSSVIINTGTVLTNNRSGHLGGAIYNNGALNIVDGQITNNAALTGGAVYSTAGSLTMYGGFIEHNEAVYDGGGIYSGNEQFVMYGGTITQNTAGQSGGGVYKDNGLLLVESGNITNNTSESDGGGVCIGGHSGSFSMASGTIGGNLSNSGSGGGIAIQSASPTPPYFTINGYSTLSDNHANSGNGGAISIPYNMLSRLNVAQGVTFEGNSSSQPYVISPYDIPMHNSHIFTRNFTVPFTYGYNNFDIEYTNGTPTEILTVTFESNGGSSVPSQTLLSGGHAIAPPNPARSGYAFCGWYSDPGLVNAWDFNTPVHENMILYACWIHPTPNERVVYFNSNGGSPVYDQVVSVGQPASEPPSPVRSCYLFAGWFSDLSLTVRWNFTQPILENTTLYAKWVPLRCPPGCTCIPGRGCVPDCCVCSCSPPEITLNSNPRTCGGRCR